MSHHSITAQHPPQGRRSTSQSAHSVCVACVNTSEVWGGRHRGITAGPAISHRPESFLSALPPNYISSFLSVFFPPTSSVYVHRQASTDCLSEALIERGGDCISWGYRLHTKRCGTRAASVSGREGNPAHHGTMRSDVIVCSREALWQQLRSSAEIILI